MGWFVYLFRRWLLAPPKAKISIKPDPEVTVSEAVELLEFAGYEVLTGKRKVSLSIHVNDQLELESRLFIDHFAAVEDELYVVKLARDRKPLEWTGSGLRDHLLVYQLLYSQVHGVLYVDLKRRSIEKIRFSIDTEGD
jgi:hypothetical protein